MRGRASSALSLLLLLGVLPSVAAAAPPRSAQIVEGRSMAGAVVGQRGELPDDDGIVRVAPFESWGTVEMGFCFEQSCQWKVPGGGWVNVQMSSRVEEMTTAARRWRTRRGVGPSSPARAVRSRYPRARLRRTCAVGGFGAPKWGFVLNSRRRGRGWTFFELFGPSGTRLRAISIGRGRLPRRSLC